MKRVKKIMALALLAVSIMGVALPAMAAQEYGKVSTPDGLTLNLRKGTSGTNYNIILKYIPNNTRLQFTYTNKTDTWYQTTYDGATGYVKSQFIVLDSSGSTGGQTVGVSWVSGTADAPGPTAPGLYQTMSTSNPIMFIQGGQPIQVLFNTTSSYWVTAKYGSSQGYMQLASVVLTSANFRVGAFGSNLLRNGVDGQAVKNLQLFLTRLGYNTQGVDGVFGDNTKNAVIAFQRANGLGVDGVAGDATKNKIVELIFQGY